MPKEYREGLPHPIPKSLQALPVQNGYPVPWFVAKVDGVYDFRCIDARKFKPALSQKLCWVCGQKLHKKLTFTIGPMCAVNRIIAEPPSHYECAEWSAKACPFLAQHQMHRRERNLPEGITEPGGIGIKRQPGVTLLWTTRRFKVVNDSSGLLFEIGDPIHLMWLRKGRLATREECLESIESGYPILLDIAKSEGDGAVEVLEQMRERAMMLVPAF